MPVVNARPRERVRVGEEENARLNIAYGRRRRQQSTLNHIVRARHCCCLSTRWMTLFDNGQRERYSRVTSIICARTRHGCTMHRRYCRQCDIRICILTTCDAIVDQRSVDSTLTHRSTTPHRCK